MNKKENRWFEPKASSCSKCPKLEKMREKASGTLTIGKKLCTEFGWEIDDKAGEKQAMCSCQREIRHRRKDA